MRTHQPAPSITLFILLIGVLVGLCFIINGIALLKSNAAAITACNEPIRIRETLESIGCATDCKCKDPREVTRSGAATAQTATGHLPSVEDEYEGLVGPEFDGLWWDSIANIWPRVSKTAYFAGVSDMGRFRERVALKPMGHTLSFCDKMLHHIEGEEMGNEQFVDAATLEKRSNVASLLKLPVSKVCIVMVRHSLKLINVIKKAQHIEFTQPRAVLVDGEFILPWQMRWTHHDVLDQEFFGLTNYSMPILVAVKDAFVSSTGHVYNEQIGTIWIGGCGGNPLPPSMSVRTALRYRKIFVTPNGAATGFSHAVIDKLARIAAYHADLIADPTIKIHIDSDRYGMIFKMLPMIGISFDRVVVGDVFGEIVYMPEPSSSGCGVPTRWHMRQIRALIRSELHRQCPQTFASEGERAPLFGGELTTTTGRSSGTGPSGTTGATGGSRRLTEAENGEVSRRDRSATMVMTAAHSPPPPPLLNGRRNVFDCRPHPSEPSLKRRWWTDASDRLHSPARKKLGVIVRRVHRRVLRNQDAMEKMVTSMYASSIKFEFFADDPPPSLLETFYLFYHADVIISPHGAAGTFLLLSRASELLADSVWASRTYVSKAGVGSKDITYDPDGTAVWTAGSREAGRNAPILIELFSKVWTPPLYRKLSKFLGLDYAMIVNKVAADTVPGENPVLTDHEVNLTDFRSLLVAKLGPGDT